MADALKVQCPDCQAPTDVPCYTSYAAGTIHADRQRAADLRALERGTCALCGSLLVRDPSQEVWHPNPEDQSCPPLPDARTHWNDYARALQAGVSPGHPGAEHFLPDPGSVAPTPVVCPECRDGKCQNCDGRALHPVTDLIVTCDCTHGAPA